jgi:hypothetical protein
VNEPGDFRTAENGSAPHEESCGALIVVEEARFVPGRLRVYLIVERTLKRCAYGSLIVEIPRFASG